MQCPGCRKNLQIAREYLGKRMACPHCSHAFSSAPPPASEQDTLGNSPPDTEPPPVERVADPWGGFLAPPQSKDELGRIGHYRVLQLLGKGGMGMVFRAEDPLLQRSVALKVMLPALAADESARQRFLREARSAAAVQHEHVVTIHQVVDDRKAPYLAMELLEGEPLDAQLRRLGRLPVDDAVRVGQQMAEGLAAAHARGLIHRDVKPANIFLVGQPATDGRRRKSDLWKAGRVKILDFGLARAARDSDHLTQAGTILGTPAYMAPEQAKSGSGVDARADLFSLGCIIYHMLTGEQPFKGEDVYAILLAVATQEPSPPQACDPFISPALSDLVMRLLQKDPEKRPATAAEVAEALEDICHEHTRPISSSDLSIPVAKPIYRAPESPTTKLLRQSSQYATAVKKRLTPILEAEKKKLLTPRRTEPAWMVHVRRAVVPAALVVFLLFAWSLLPRRSPAPAPTEPPVVAVIPPVKIKPAPPVVKLPPSSITNSIGMQFLLIPKGTFKMGSPRNELDRFNNEEQHEVDISEPFYMGVHEVTQSQFEKVMAINPSIFRPQGAGAARVKDVDTANLPVENVSWKQAVEFCEKLSDLPEEKSEGRVYRLPAEAEWEYACRGNSPGVEATNFGVALSSFQANFNGNHPFGQASKGSFLALTTVVGKYPANRFGLYDMHGNVAEWCADWHEGLCISEPGPPVPQTDPADPKRVRALRGGSWASAGRGCRTAARTFAEPDDRSPYWGFRVAITMPSGFQP